MLQKTKSKQLNLIKYALLIPLVFGMLIYTSTEVSAQQKAETQEKVVDQELTYEELVKKYYDQFAEMNKDHKEFSEILESLSMSSNNKYIQSREEYLKFVAFGRYMRQMIVESKSENGTLTQQDIDITEEMKSRKYKTYAEYRDWKKTNEAKEQWELNTQDGVLKLVVNDLGSQTEEEKKRFDGLMKQLEVDDYFKKLVVCEASGGGSLIIDSPNNPHPNAEENLKVVESIEVPFSVIDEVPTLKECEDLPTNNERKKCMNQFVNIHVNKNFNIKLADSLSPGRKRIFVSFKIDKDGKIKNIQARGPSAALEEEAKRVISTLPQFVPGRQKGELVTVPYSLPIVFKVADDTKDFVLTKKDSSVTHVLKKIKDSLQNQNVNKKIDLEEIPFSVIEETPVHPDCTSISSESDKKDCTNHAVNKHIGKNFQTNLAKSLDLPAGKQRIFTQFVIDNTGNITNVKVRGAHPKLEEEVVRVLKLLPKFTPGMQDGKRVNVPFSIPIVFSVADLKKD